MTDFNLTQIEAELLIGMEKHRVSDELYFDPFADQSLTIPLYSPDKRENFYWISAVVASIYKKASIRIERGR